ncbi:GH39 family glycosyl hydrolase [Iodobacter fluviatilis]|uniref:Beta-xylosidase n=1 Tax=Iodobacter fluviatilis TaxID=537 RepID=A0A377Q673_9NEIS|nr:cellulase family glycosylhydrolase [Iodobacter fluviatilis]TCU87091.1 beta-xylosidase [Iodobacter fluviatilis]STQ90423.1 Beta-xylosidase [Iodobacter fluviatilis]
MRFINCCLFTALLAGTALGAETKLVASKPLVWRDFLGVNAHFLWFSPQQAAQQMDRLRDLGLEWTRVDLHWDRHEAKENEYLFKPIDHVVDALKEKQLKSVFYLVGSAPFASSAPASASNKDQYPPKDNEVFAKRLGMLAHRYPSVDAWQVWNEPNLPSFWQPVENAADYGRLLQSSVRVLKQVAPSKPVVMAGMAYYSQMPVRKGLMLEELGKMGALGLGAVVAYHPYSQEPEGDEVKARDFILRSKEINQRLRAMKVPGIWATEWGWSSYAGPEEEQKIIGEAGQADYLLRRLVLMSVADFDRIFLFALSDLDSRAGVRDRSYGLLNLQGKPKPAYTALARFLKITGPRLLPGDAPDYKGTLDGLYSVGWKKPDGTHLWMFWANQPGQLELALSGDITLHQPLSGLKTSLKSSTLAVTRQLQILEWR